MNIICVDEYRSRVSVTICLLEYIVFSMTVWGILCISLDLFPLLITKTIFTKNTICLFVSKVRAGVGALIDWSLFTGRVRLQNGEIEGPKLNFFASPPSRQGKTSHVTSFKGWNILLPPFSLLKLQALVLNLPQNLL